MVARALASGLPASKAPANSTARTWSASRTPPASIGPAGAGQARAAMIAGLPHPVITRRTRACPAIVGPGTAVGPGRRPAAYAPGPPPAWLPPPAHPDRVVFDKLIQVLVFGCGYRRIADATCSATTLRRRRDEWITLGLADRLRLAVLGAYERLFGLELDHLAVDGCITKAPAAARPPGPARSTAASRGSSAPRSPRRTASRWVRWRPQPTVATTGCWRHVGPLAVLGVLPARPGGAPGRRLRLPALPAGADRLRHGRRDRHAGRASPDPGGPPVGGRAHPRLG
jgi:hypothetical protein